MCNCGKNGNCCCYDPSKWGEINPHILPGYRPYIPVSFNSGPPAGPHLLGMLRGLFMIALSFYALYTALRLILLYFQLKFKGKKQRTISYKIEELEVVDDLRCWKSSLTTHDF